MDQQQSATFPTWLVVLMLAGATTALAGGFWDDSWHTERGRDTFFVPPHIAIYLGLAGIGAGLSLWVLQAARREGFRAVLRDPIMLLAIGSVTVTLLGAPIDNAWHEIFGRDAVAWSPPHMMGVVGSLGLAAALLAVLGQRRLLGPVAGALTFAAATFAAFEYDTDVPQFDAVWYLPVLSLGAGIAAALIQLTSPRRWAVTAAAAVHLGFLVGVSLFLLTVDFPPVGLPLLTFPALALDLARHRGLRVGLQALLFTAAVYAAYVPVRNYLGDGVFIDGADIAVGFPLAFAAVWLVFAFARRGPRRARAWGPGLAASSVGLALLLAGAPVARAHDPGQGEPAGGMDLEAFAANDVAGISGRWLAPECGAEPVSGEVVARRAGEEIRGPLQLRGCSFRGSVEVTSRGRWFVYASLDTGRRLVESWLPVHNSDKGERVSEFGRYAYEPRDPSSASFLKYIGGAALYAAMAGLLLLTILLLRRRRELPASTQPSAP